MFFYLVLRIFYNNFTCHKYDKLITVYFIKARNKNEHTMTKNIKIFLIFITLTLVSVQSSVATTYTRTKINTASIEKDYMIVDNVCYMCAQYSALACVNNASSVTWLTPGDAISVTTADEYAGIALPTGKRTTFTCNLRPGFIGAPGPSDYIFQTNYVMDQVVAYPYNTDYIIIDDICIMCADYSSTACSAAARITWFGDGDTVSATGGLVPGPVKYSCSRSGSGFSIVTPCTAGYYGSTSCLRCPSSESSTLNDNAFINKCYIPANSSRTNTKGTYRYASNCYYSI